MKNLGLESYRYEWEVLLNDDVPMVLDVALGTGESAIDLSDVNVTRVDLKTGVGGVNLNLTGERDRDVEVSMRGGADRHRHYAAGLWAHPPLRPSARWWHPSRPRHRAAAYRRGSAPGRGILVSRPGRGLATCPVEKLPGWP